ncbi:hypothetical protein NE865_08644 [Phthorimaea operculella]|nr:hypothetical protein NE865_08644 [Phthorimaea operculella]
MDDDMDIIKSNYTIKDLNVRCNGKFYNDAISCTSGLNGEYEGFFMLKGKTLEDLKLATENQNRWKNPAWDKDNFCFEYLINDFEELSVNMYYLTYPKPAELTLEDYYAQKKFFEFKVSAFIISSIFLLLVLVVYGSLPQLRRLPGMVQMAYCATYATALILNAAKIIVQLQIAEMLTDREIYFNRLIYLTYVIYYLLLSSFFWMNIMSFDIWWTFRGLHKQRKIHRDGELAKFCWYALYAWGTPLLITIVAVIIDRSDLRKYNIIKPHFEDSLALTMEFNLYFNIPVGVLLLFNIYFFSLTAYTYWRIKKGLRKIQDSGTSNGKFRFEMYLKLAVVMGVGWIIEVFIDSIPKWLEYISAVYNGFIGVAIFIVFVVKRHICVKFCQRYGLQHRFKFVANLEQKWSSTKTQREDSKRSMSSCDSGIQMQMTPTMR